MNFIESTTFFLRTIAFDFVNRDKNVLLKFRLVPMFHIGSETFYNEAMRLLEDCQEIFYEGRKGLKMPLYKNRFKKKAQKLGLVTQREYLKLEQLNAKLTHTDFDEAESEKQWKQLKFLEKIKFQLYPLLLWKEYGNETRQQLAKHYMSRIQELQLAYGPLEKEPGTMWNFLLFEREKILINHINKIIKNEKASNKMVGIPWGAGHMKSIARYLIDVLGFVPQNGQFLKVFDVE